MPSGAKKRKAARKKKEKENNNNNNPSSTNNPHQGNDELKSQDEKGSDGGEGNSPAYHEHGDRHDPFNGGSEEVEAARDPPAARPFASDVKSVEEVPGDVKIEQVLGGKEDSVVMIERDLKPEESYERKDASFEHIETAKESCYESGKAGGTSNGESVSQVLGGKENSVVTLERDLKSDESCEGKNVSFEHIEIAKESCYERGNGGCTSNGKSLAEKNSKDENFNSLEEATACHELVKSVDSSPPELSLISKNAPAEGEEASGNSAAEYSMNSVKAAASVSEVENSDAGSVLVEKSVVPPLEKTNLVVKTNNDNVYSLTDENVRTSCLEEPKPKEYDSKVLTSLSASPFAKLTNGAEHIKNSETTECSENQPRVTSAPNMVQKTSWWNCCGLFEVLSGSNR